MKRNFLALKTIQYIWSHPNCQNKKIRSILRFLTWQLYKRLIHKHIDIRLVDNTKIRCYPDGYSAAAVLYCGLYDYDEMTFLLRYLRAEDSFLDIGANVGVYTLLAASKIKSGLIYSFEVLPKNYTRLLENLKLNQFDQVQPYEIGVSNQSGTILLNLAEEDSQAFITYEKTMNTIEVKTDSLDNLLKDQSLNNLTLAKIDIEGAELLAFKGALSLFNQQIPPVWILEINALVKNIGHKEQDVVDFLDNYDYQLYNYNAKTNNLAPISLEQQKGFNVLAIHKTALDFVLKRLKEETPHV